MRLVAVLGRCGWTDGRRTMDQPFCRILWATAAHDVPEVAHVTAECIAVALVATADTYWVEIQSAEAWCRHPQRNMIHFPAVRIDPPQTDVVYEVITKFVLMALSPSSYRHWTEAPLCPGASGREWTTPEQMKWRPRNPREPHDSAQMTTRQTCFGLANNMVERPGPGRPAAHHGRSTLKGRT